MAEKNILVVAAHPDDEVLGCGGAVRKLLMDGCKVDCLILAEGLTSRVKERDEMPEDKLNELRKNAHDAAKIIGFDNLFFENFPDNRMDSVDLLEVIQVINGYVEQLRPQVIFTHHHGDLNIDHRITYQATLTACRPLEGSPVKEIYSFQVPSSTEWNFPYHRNVFSPNMFVDITKTIEEKIAAMACYESESRKPPHPRSGESLRAIAAQWGSVVGVRFAEAFETIYRIM